MIERKLKILIVEARFYERIQDALLDGAKSALDAFDAEYDVVTVPGALEVPIAISMADEAGVSLDADDGAVEERHRLAAGPLVGPFVEGQLDAVGGDGPDLHGGVPVGCY